MRYLLLVMLFISQTATAECYMVTELMTKWQMGLDALGIPVGQYKDKEFRLTLSEDKASVSPGSMNCMPLGKSAMECGEDLRLVRLNESEIEQLKRSGQIGADADPKKFVYTVTKGNVEQIWHLFFENNTVVLMIPEEKEMKQYHGIIKGKC